MMTTSVEQVHEEIEEMFGQVPDWMREMPESALVGFWHTMRDFDLAETEIPNKYKELIGIAVAGATRCKYCVFFHTESARLHGATDEEIAEAAMMGAMTMSGSTFLNGVMSDYATFCEQTREMVQYAREHAERMPQTSAPEGHSPERHQPL
jgi:AhpD family alkylhydroperoxidase